MGYPCFQVRVDDHKNLRRHISRDFDGKYGELDDIIDELGIESVERGKENWSSEACWIG